MDRFATRSDSRTAAWLRGLRGAIVTVAAGALLAAPSIGWASADEMSKEAGLGTAAALSSLVYAPLKVAYAAGGLLVGGLAWCFSGGDSEVAQVVITPSILGDYVITPKQLTGDEPIEFFGRDPDYREGQLASAPARSRDDSYDSAW